MARSYEALNSPTLINGLKAGLVDAQEQFAKLGGELLIPILMHHFSLSRPDSEELTNDALHKAMRHIDQYDAQKSAFSKWLISIAIHAAQDFLQKKRRQIATIPLSKSICDTSALREPAKDPSGKPLDPHRTLLGRAMQALNANEKRVIDWRSRDFSFPQIAVWSGKPEGTIKVMHGRALKKLARLCRGRDLAGQ